MAAPAQRYTAVAIVLHWAIAFAIALMIPLGFWMHEEAEHGAGAEVFAVYQLHKSIGLTVLALSLARLVWRLINPPPPFPAHMPGWERFVAKATHWAFYALIIGLPLTGWLYVSAGWSIHDDQPLAVPTRWFGLFTVPHLFGLPDASGDVRADVAEAALSAHALLAWTTVALAALHVAAALKHHFFDRDEVLAHMVPGLRAPFETEAAPKNPTRLAVLGGGLGLTAVALAAALFAIGGSLQGAPPRAAEAPAEVAEEQSETLTAETPVTAIEPGAPEAAGDEIPIWRVDQGASSLAFAFTYDDVESGGSTRFEGRFTRWRADIRFDPDRLDASTARVTIELASAIDGVALHERTLPTPDWFNVAVTPTATFRTSEFRRREGSAYEARGELSLRGESRNVTLPFTLRIDGDRAIMDGRTTIDRRAYGVGADSDADDMISRDVEVIIHVEATRAP